MSKATVLDLVDTLSGGEADATLADRYYDEVVIEIGRLPIMTAVSLTSATAGTAIYTIPSAAIRILGVAYDDTMLSEDAAWSLETHNPDWRYEVGSPIAFTVDDETERTIRVYPVPVVPSGDFSFVFGEPLGRDFPPYSLVFVHTEKRTDVLPWLELPIALAILAREYGRSSNHFDPALAEAYGALASLTLQMVS